MSFSSTRPPWAPVFTPTIEEFSDPLSYIKTIYGVAFNYGICKIRPPSGWRPPFCADPLLFSFTPRLQNLSEVSAYNRSRNDFITSVVNFWEAQDVTVFVPYIKRKKLDIYSLWKVVQSNGGYRTVCEKKLWLTVGKSLGFEDVPQCAAAISSKYKKILLPYEIFISEQVPSKYDPPTRQKHSRNSSGSKRKQSVTHLVCRVCGRGDNDACLLLCDGCETLGACHTYCLNPPLSDVPRGAWFCHECISRRFRRLQVNIPFGFMPSKKPRTLSKFNNYADEFKSNHFGKPAHMISTDEVESEFWRLLDEEETDIVVEYGADLSAREHGSGFPTQYGKVTGVGRSYVHSPWNLNNVALSRGSALRFIPKDISGMIIPWCYVGMVFSCFCWHTEDHWSYSINYMHTGSPKIWYGVPTTAADAFEAAMRAEVPELFKNSPDLLHHMTTMIPPEKVQAYGVPVYRLEQMTGEFVITFPRSYHAGFNAGFNFAEAVNFCPADWFELGQHSIDHYALSHRAPVFSHAELLCRMAASTEPLEVDFLVVVSKQLESLLTTERSLRRHLARLGVRRAERMVFEETEDEKRECDLCRTTLYLSALTCRCKSTMVCLAHHQARTCCPREEQVMRYRYGLDELSESINKLRVQLDEYRQWARRVTQCTTTSAIAESPIVQPKAENNEFTKDSSPHCETNPVPLSDSKDPSPVPESAEDGKSEANADLSSQMQHLASNVASESAEYKPEDDWKPTIAELQTLIATGEARNYPQEMVNSLKRTIETVSECTTLIELIVANYRSACEATVESQSDPVKKRSNSRERSGRLTKTIYNSSDDETSAAEIVNEDNEVVGANGDDKAGTESESDSTSSSLSSDESEDNSQHPDKSHDPSHKPLISPVRELSPVSGCITETRTQTQRKRTMLNSPRTRSSPRVKSEPPDSLSTISVTTRSKSLKQSGSKLSLVEFNDILQMAHGVRVYLPGWDEIEQVSNHLKSWKVRAQEIIASSNVIVDTAPLPEDLPSVKEVDQLLRFGDAVNIDLDEMKELRRLHEWLSWIESVESVLATASPMDLASIQSKTAKLSLERLYLLQIQGSAMSAAVTYSSFRASQRTGPWDQDNWDEGPIPKLRIDRALHHTSERLLRVIYSARQSEAKLLAITKAKPHSLTLKDVMNEVQQLDTMPVSLPLAEDIRQMCKESELIAQEITAIGKLLVSTPFGKQVSGLDADRFPESLYDQLCFGTLDCTSAGWKTCLEELAEKVHDSPIRLPHFDRVRQLLNFVDHCRDRLVQLFIWPHSRLSLLELLLPRPATALDSLLDFDAVNSETGLQDWESGRPVSMRRHSRASLQSAPAYALSCKENAREFAKTLVTCTDAGLLYDTIYRRYIETERDLMIRLRSANMAKSHAKQQNSVIYCVCRKPGFAGFMLQCELCRDWFHGKCVCLPTLKDSETERLRYMCPRCERSLRPDLNQVLSVLDDLIQALPVERSDNESTGGEHADGTSSNRIMCLLRLPEFVAVQLLCERAFLFIRQLRETILSTPELYRAIVEYEQFSGVKMPLDTYTEENGPSSDLVQSESLDSCPSSKSSSRAGCLGGSFRQTSRTSGQSERPYSNTGRARDARSSKRLEEEAMLAAREINDLSTEFSYRSQDPNVMSLLMMRKQARKAPLVARGTVSGRVDTGQEAEAAEALADMSTSVYRGGVSSSERPRHIESHLRSVGHSSAARGSSSIGCRSVGSRIGSKTMRGNSGRSGPSVAYMPVRRDTSGGGSSDPSNKWKDENVESNSKIRPPSVISQPAHSPSHSAPKFRFVLSSEAREILESLIMEACLLEINIPQTRWLWQLHLATDPEVDASGGACSPFVARAEEEKLKRRFVRHLSKIKCGGKRRRQTRKNSGSADEGSDDSQNVATSSSMRGEQIIDDLGSPSQSDTASSTPCSTRSTSDRQTYGEVDTRRSKSSSRFDEAALGRSRPVANRPHDAVVRRKPYRPRGGVTMGSISRRHELTQGKRFQATKKRRALNRSIMASTAGGRFAVHYPSARYMNMKLYRQRLTSINRHSGSSEARMRCTRLTGSEGAIRQRRPRRGAAAERATYRTPNTPYTSDSERSSTAEEEGHYRSTSESNAIERARQAIVPPRRRRIGRNVALQGSRPSRRLPRDRNEVDEILLNRRRGRRQPVGGASGGGNGSGWPVPEGNSMETESDSGSTAPDRADECAARPCENPRTGTVEWIACDSCERWFHQLCVGIRHRSQVPEIYECPRCSRTSSLHVGDTLPVHRERNRARRMQNSSTVTGSASATTSSNFTVSSAQPGSSSMSSAPPMRMREFHYSDYARARSSHLSYMAVQRPIGWSASNTTNTLPVSSRSNTDLLHAVSRTRTAPAHHLTMGSGSMSYEHVTERPLAAAVADQWVADYPHSPGTDELDSSALDPTPGTVDSLLREEGSRFSDPLIHTSQTSKLEDLVESVPGASSYDTTVNPKDSLKAGSKGPTEVLLEAIEVLSGTVDSNCSPDQSS